MGMAETSAVLKTEGLQTMEEVVVHMMYSSCDSSDSVSSTSTKIGFSLSFFSNCFIYASRLHPLCDRNTL